MLHWRGAVLRPVSSIGSAIPPKNHLISRTRTHFYLSSSLWCVATRLKKPTTPLLTRSKIIHLTSKCCLWHRYGIMFWRSAVLTVHLLRLIQFLTNSPVSSKYTMTCVSIAASLSRVPTKSSRSVHTATSRDIGPLEMKNKTTQTSANPGSG